MFQLVCGQTLIFGFCKSLLVIVVYNGRQAITGTNSGPHALIDLKY